MLCLHRWTRYAKDRLYVTEADGRIAGWLDLLSGEVQIEWPDRAEEIEALIEGWFAEHGATLERRSALCGAATPSEPLPKRELTFSPTLLAS